MKDVTTTNESSRNDMRNYLENLIQIFDKAEVVDDLYHYCCFYNVMNSVGKT